MTIFRFRCEGSGEIVRYSDGTSFGPFRTISEALEALDDWLYFDKPSDAYYRLVQEPEDADAVIPWTNYPWRIVA